ncbi:hypothetical protein J6590_045962 [Homalodisca vitripennis]|nr:hypothetical protein J6590_045962 [Homalodisca vitripennis]
MDIGDRVDSIESGIASNAESAKSLAGSSQVDVSLVVEEVNERLLRSKNIMIFGLPESLMTNPNEKRESDKRNIEAILSSADPNSNSSSLRFFRVGKGSASNLLRLLLVAQKETRSRLLKHKFEILHEHLSGKRNNGLPLIFVKICQYEVYFRARLDDSSVSARCCVWSAWTKSP